MVHVKMQLLMKYNSLKYLFLVILVASQFRFGITDNNLTCYQCVRNSNTECGEESLLMCPPVSDRCVTYITKSSEKGLTIKRECGLGPCGFDDDMANRGLGLDGCDRSKHEYFCLFCCKENGCNKSSASLHRISTNITYSIILIFTFQLIRFVLNSKLLNVS